MPRIVRIPGLDEPLSFPTGTPDQEIVSAVIDRLFPVAPIPERPKEEAGFTGGFGEGITALGGLGTTVPYLVAPTEERRTAAAKAAEPESEFQALSDIEGVGDLFRFVREQGGQALGFMAAPLAAAKTAAVVSGPAAPIAAPAAFLTTAGLQYLANTVGRQAQEQEVKAQAGEPTEAPDVTKALISSAGQAGLDLVGFKFFKPLGELVGLGGKEAAERTAKEIAETAAQGDAVGAAEKLIGKESVLLGAGKGAAIEGAQEPIQAVLERFGAGLDLASDDAIQEYFEAAVAGGLLGAPLGAGSTALGNVQRGAYDKKLITDLSNTISGKPSTQEQLNEEWDKQRPTIIAEAQPSVITDDTGNFAGYTPELLESFGIAPQIKTLSTKNDSMPVEDILKQNLGDKGTAAHLFGVFTQRMADISRRLKEQGANLKPEEVGALVKQYEMAAKGANTMRVVLDPDTTLDSPTNWVIRPSAEKKGKFELYNPVTGKVGAVNKKGEATLFNSAQDAGNFAAKSIDVEIRKTNNKSSDITKAAKKEAEKSPEQKDVEEANLEQAAQTEEAALAGLEADIRAGFGVNADRVFEKAQEYQDAGSTRLDALQKASIDVNQEVQADAEAEAQAEAQAEATPTTPTTPTTPKPTTPKPTTPKPTTPTTPTTPKPTQQIKSIADAIRAIDPDPDSEFADFANAAQSARNVEEAALIQDLAERLKRAYATAQNPSVSEADRDAAVEQSNKIYGELEALQAAPAPEAPKPKAPAPKKEKPTGQVAAGISEAQAAARTPSETVVIKGDDLPIEEQERILREFIEDQQRREARSKLSKEEVKDIIEANGNAKEANKISNELKKQACD